MCTPPISTSPKKTADVTVESEVRNSSGDRATVALTVADRRSRGQVRARFAGEPVDMVDGEKTMLTASGALKTARFWSPEDPYLYDVYTILTVEGKDRGREPALNRVSQDRIQRRRRHGRRLSQRQIYLSQRVRPAPSDEWAGLGRAIDWMHDYTAKWSALPWELYPLDAYFPAAGGCGLLRPLGIVQVCPRAIRNTPGYRASVGATPRSHARLRSSISATTRAFFFGRPATAIVTPEGMKEMVALRQQWDPKGGRVMGYRGQR